MPVSFISKRAAIVPSLSPKTLSTNLYKGLGNK